MALSAISPDHFLSRPCWQLDRWATPLTLGRHGQHHPEESGHHHSECSFSHRPYLKKKETVAASKERSRKAVLTLQQVKQDLQGDITF